MRAERLVHCIDDLLLDGLILSPDDGGTRQSEHDQRGQERVLSHEDLLLAIGATALV